MQVLDKPVRLRCMPKANVMILSGYFLTLFSTFLIFFSIFLNLFLAIVSPFVVAFLHGMLPLDSPWAAAGFVDTILS